MTRTFYTEIRHQVIIQGGQLKARCYRGGKHYQVNRWYMLMHADAIDGVSVPSLLGMSQYGDGGFAAIGASGLNCRILTARTTANVARSANWPMRSSPS